LNSGRQAAADALDRYGPVGRVYEIATRQRFEDASKISFDGIAQFRRTSDGGKKSVYSS
jgi:hypothetical protein